MEVKCPKVIETIYLIKMIKPSSLLIFSYKHFQDFESAFYPSLGMEKYRTSKNFWRRENLFLFEFSLFIPLQSAYKILPF